MAKKILRVGFDLDGVLLYNPARIVRPAVVLFKKVFLKKEVSKFHLPKTKIQKIIWFFLHKSSVYSAPGLDEIKKLTRSGKIKAYIVSARYEFLREDFERWVKKLEADEYFSGYYFNNNNEQPHLFKEQMIKKLKLDIFVEDNWDIVNHLSSKFKKNSRFKTFWIYNLFDRGIGYSHKFPSLKKVVEFIRSQV